MTLRSFRLFLCSTLLLALPLTLDAAEKKRRITAEDLWAMERVGAPTLSPDGRWAAFTVTRYSMEKNQGDGDIWLVPADGSAPPRRLTWNEGTDGSPVWSPDGSKLAFVSKRGEGPPQLFLLPIEGGEAEPVTKLPVAVQDPRWFPDGKRIAFQASTWPDLNDDWDAVGKRAKEQTDDKVQAKISDTRIFRFWDQYLTDGRLTHIFAVDLDSREVKDLTPGLSRFTSLGGGGSWDLAPDGKEIVFTANSTSPPYQKMNIDLYLLPLGESKGEGKAGKTAGKAIEPKNITATQPADEGNPRYSPDGRYIIFGRGTRPEWDPDFSRFARYDRRSGEIRPLADDWDGAPDDWTFTPDGQTLVFHGQERGRTHIYTLPIDGGQPKVIARGGSTAGVEVGPDPARQGGLRLVFQNQSFLVPTELFSIGIEGIEGGEPKALTTFNTKRIAELDLGTTGEATFEGGGGDQVHMMLVFPPGFDKRKKYPLVHLIHGGPHGAFSDEFHYRWNAPLFASPGYVVALVNFHGSTGYGQKFADAIVGNHADLPYADIMKATDYLIAQGYIDEKKMAATGGSYGGYMTDWILGHTDRFAALVSHAGVYDLMAQFASDATWGRPTNYGGAPWTDPAKVDRYSPSRFATSFNTPTLLLHGDKDFRVPYTQSVNLYGVLQGKGVPSRIVVFPGENHWILKPQASVLWYKEVLTWLQRYLGGTVPQAPSELAKAKEKDKTADKTTAKK